MSEYLGNNLVACSKNSFNYKKKHVIQFLFINVDTKLDLLCIYNVEYNN